MDLLYMSLLVISVFYIRLFASTTIEATSVISKGKNLHTNTPVERNRSCALLATDIDVTNMTDTCPYPELFSYETGTCEMFYLVDCSDRDEPFTPCDYPNTNCSWGDPNNHSLCTCEQVHDLNYAFCHAFNKQDGLYHWPGRRWKPYYINCTNGRTIPGSCNEASAVFDYLKEECRSLEEALKNAFALSLMSQIPSSMLHLLTPFVPDWSHKQSTVRNSIASTVFMSSIMNFDQLSFSSEPYSASISFDQFHSHTAGANTIPTSFVSNEHVTKSEKLPHQLLYSPDYIDSSMSIVENQVNNQYQSNTLRYTQTTPFVFREGRTINESLSKRVDDYDENSSEPETSVSHTENSSWSLPNTIYQSQKSSPSIKPTPAVLHDTDSDINALISNSNEYLSSSLSASSVVYTYETEEKLDHSTYSGFNTSSETLQNTWFMKHSVTKLDDSNSISLIASNSFEGSDTPVFKLSSFTYETNEITDSASFVRTSSVMSKDRNEQNNTSKPASFTSSHHQQAIVGSTELLDILNTSLHSVEMNNDMSEQTVLTSAYPLQLITIVPHSSQSISSDSSFLFDTSAVFSLDVNSLTTDLPVSSTSSFTSKQSQDTSFFQLSHLNTPSNLPVLAISDSDTSKNIFHFNSESIDSNNNVELGLQSALLHIPLTNVKLSSTTSIQFSSDLLSSQSNFDMSTFSNSARHLSSSKQNDQLSKATSISYLVPGNVLSEYTTITTTLLTTANTQTNPIESIVSTLGINEEINEFSNTYFPISISSKTHSTVDQIREQASLSPMFSTTLSSTSETPLKENNTSNRHYQLSSTRDAGSITPSFTMHVPTTRLQDLTFAPTPSAVSSSTMHGLHSVQSYSDTYPRLPSTGAFIRTSGTQSENIHATRASNEKAVESTIEYVSGYVQSSYLLHSSQLISLKDSAMSTISNSKLGSSVPTTNIIHLTTQLSSSLTNTSAFPGTKEAQRSDDKKDIGVLIGIIIGACVAFVLVVLIAVCLVRRASRNQKDDMNEMPPELAAIETKPALHVVKKL